MLGNHVSLGKKGDITVLPFKEVAVCGEDGLYSHPGYLGAVFGFG